MGLDEERDLRKRLETEAGELRALFLEQIQPLSEEEQTKKLGKYDRTIREAVDRALREQRKQSFSRRMMDIAEDVPLLPNFIGKPLLGGFGFIFDGVRILGLRKARPGPLTIPGYPGTSGI
jgi:hypothetical protein